MFRLCKSLIATIFATCALATMSYSAPVKHTETVLYSFRGTGGDGIAPVGGLVRDKKGNLYGVTEAGGTDNLGTAFKLTPDGVESILHSFVGNIDDGANPFAGLLMDKNDNLYGTTQQGGPANAGTVFKLTPDGKERVLYSFAGGIDGSQPHASLIMDNHGYLYGTTQAGGTANAGTVFKLAPNGTEEILHSFAGGAEGALPYTSLFMGSDRLLYGTTLNGGNDCDGTGYGCGIVFKMKIDGSHFKVLHSFSSSDGALPTAPFIQDGSGNLYSTTALGGLSRSGTVFEVTTGGKETVLYSFTGGNDGSNPQSGVIMDVKGDFYGTAYNGGSGGAGTLFKLMKKSGEKTLYSFSGSNGEGPYQIIMDKNKNFYGVTVGGGGTNSGTVFEIKK